MEREARNPGPAHQRATDPGFRFAHPGYEADAIGQPFDLVGTRVRRVAWLGAPPQRHHPQ
jgi:hypothetical protein